MIYNFKKETKVYVVVAGLRYTLDVYPDLTFSQTFNETSVPVKTLHSQYDMFENAVITKANPANFTFTVPMLYEADLNIVYNLLLDYDTGQPEATLKTADLYFETNSEVYKIEKCAFESGTFQIQKDAAMTLNLSGSGKKLSKFTGAIPGTLQARSATRSFGRVTAMEILIKGSVQPYISAVTVEVKNNVTWVDFATLQNSQSVKDASGTMYPEAFVVGSRVLSGTIQQYVTDETRTNVNGWSTSAPISISAGELGKASLFKVTIPAAVYTNRLEVQDLYTQSYDFRMVSNPATLSSVINKVQI